MIKIYRKTATTKAEQFDDSDEMIDRLLGTDYVAPNMGVDDETDSGLLFATKDGFLELKVGDWIATGADGEHWLIPDDVFRKTYAKLPVIPKAVADWIEECKENNLAIAAAMDQKTVPTAVRNYFRCYKTCDQWVRLQNAFARAWLDGYQVEVSE